MAPGQDDEVRDESGHLLRELHGITLLQIVQYLVLHLGFEALAARVPINCFAVNPSIQSTVKFLRRTPWARTQVEALYVEVRTRELQKYA